MVGHVFRQAGVRMSAMWHLVVDHETIGPVDEEMRTNYDGPVVISQDLTVFDVTQQAVVVRQAAIDPLSLAGRRHVERVRSADVAAGGTPRLVG
jgi:ribonuclease Z